MNYLKRFPDQGFSEIFSFISYCVLQNRKKDLTETEKKMYGEKTYHRQIKSNTFFHQAVVIVNHLLQLETYTYYLNSGW